MPPPEHSLVLIDLNLTLLYVFVVIMIAKKNHFLLRLSSIKNNTFL